jgi:hypothetical protein
LGDFIETKAKKSPISPGLVNPDIRNALKKGDFLERLNFGPMSTPCILGTVTARQNHLHITSRDINEEYNEESIHQHCMKNEHPHTKTKQTLFITLEPLVSVVDF